MRFMSKYQLLQTSTFKGIFDCTIDHLALTHIMKNNTEPGSERIKRLLEVLSTYSFNLNYMKGKDLTLGEFLSRIKVDKSKPS